MMKSNNQFLDLYRASLRAMLDVMKASLADAKHFHTRQLKTITDALSDRGEKAKRVATAATFEDLIEVQTELARTQLREAMLCWISLCETAGWNRMDAPMLRIGDGLREILGMAPAGAEPVTSMWKSMVDAVCGACALTSKAAVYATRIAADQVELVNVAVREESGNATPKAA